MTTHSTPQFAWCRAGAAIRVSIALAIAGVPAIVPALATGSVPLRANAPRKCRNVSGDVLGTKALVTRLHPSGTSCSAARKLASDYLVFVDQTFTGTLGCAPGDGSATCTVDGYSCRATAAQQGSADNLTCRKRRATVSWHVNWHPR